MNENEDGLIKTLDRNHALGFAPALVRLVAARIAGKPSLQRYVADLVKGRTPGDAGSCLEGYSQEALWQIRSRLVRELLAAVRQRAVVERDPAQRRALERLAAAIARCLPAARTVSSEAEGADGVDVMAGLDIGDVLRAWVGLMKELRIPDIDFLIPGRCRWLTAAETT